MHSIQLFLGIGHFQRYFLIREVVQIPQILFVIHIRFHFADGVGNHRSLVRPIILISGTFGHQIAHNLMILN